MLICTCNFNSVTKKYGNFFEELPCHVNFHIMAATVMTVEYDTTHYFSSQLKKFKASVLPFFRADTRIMENRINCEILVYSNPVTNINMDIN